MNSRPTVLTPPGPTRPSPLQPSALSLDATQSGPSQPNSARPNATRSSFPRPGMPLAAHSSADPLCAALASIKGLELIGAYQGRLTLGQYRAAVTLEPHHAIRFALPITDCLSAVAALRAGSGAPFNVRVARNQGTLELIADTRSDRPDLLAESVREIRAGFLQLLESGNPPANSERPSEPAAVRAMLDQMGWDSQSVIATAHGWELRPRLNASTVPVQLDHDEITGGLRLWRTALPAMPLEDETRRRALVELALRLNGQFRLARLVESDGELRCETRFRPSLLDAAWLSISARAVAVAGHYSEQRLRLVAAEPAVAVWYDRMFGEPSARDGSPISA
jgi:hypothetical protein